MDLKDIFGMGDDKPEKKRKALKTVLKKLKAKRDDIAANIKAGASDRKLRKLKAQLKANKLQRTKARKLIAELE